MNDDPLLSSLTAKQEQKSTVKSLFDDDDTGSIKFNCHLFQIILIFILNL